MSQLGFSKRGGSAAEARHPGPLIRTAEELRCYVANQERRRDAGSALALKEAPPPAPPDQKH